MRYLLGVLFVVVGVVNVVLRTRIARANAAPGRTSLASRLGTHSPGANPVVPLLIGSVFAVIGVLILVGVIHVR
jgi:hypothetical protein